ncbi:MAG TPA: histidinol dehydrogenase [bacterium]
MKIIRTWDADFDDNFRSLIMRNLWWERDVERIVSRILENVYSKGDKALFYYAKKYDKSNVSPSSILVSEAEIHRAYYSVLKEEIDALKFAAKRIERFHKRDIPKSWFFKENGIRLGKVVQPLERVGLYVPGGKAAYPSTVLMNAIPAIVAGVKDIIITTPPYKEGVNHFVLVAADILGINKIYKIGGAQAIAAMTYGTETIPKVDKIVGPGNIYVATAKRMVHSHVGIDMVAGPTELLIVADESIHPSFVAMDLLSQAEHDERAIPVLVCFSAGYGNRVKNYITSFLKKLNRKEIAEVSIRNNGMIIIARNIEEVARIVNSFAPEHLELCCKNSESLLRMVRNAGAIFIGSYTPEAVGDYIAGPNHVLPTGGTARFASPLSVEDFLKKSNVVFFTRRKLKMFRNKINRIASMEGLDAHTGSVDIRIESAGDKG